MGALNSIRRLWVGPLLALVVSAPGCALDNEVTFAPPPDGWSPALNTHPDGSVFQGLVDRYVGEGLPGVVLLVRTPVGQWNGAAGLARIESGEPMLPTHRHLAASVTKMYTATAVMLLSEDGLIDLDARMGEYLQEAICEPIPNGSQATVRQLLGHTSGIPDFSGSLAYDLDTLNDPLGSYPPERMLGYVHGQAPLFAPGTGYFYSNVNYLLLALVMDHVTGASHARVISERILQPLGLDATYYKEEPGYPRPAGLVNSYEDLAGSGTLVNVSDLAVHDSAEAIGYAGLFATSADFATFIEALLGGRLVGRASVAAMQEPGEHGSAYGLGLSLTETPYGVGSGHSGASTGVLSQVRRFPGLDATLVLLVNAGDSGAPEELFHRLWDDVLAAVLSPLQGRPTSVLPSTPDS